MGTYAVSYRFHSGRNNFLLPRMTNDSRDTTRYAWDGNSNPSCGSPEHYASVLRGIQVRRTTRRPNRGLLHPQPGGRFWQRPEAGGWSHQWANGTRHRFLLLYPDLILIPLGPCNETTCSGYTVKYDGGPFGGSRSDDRTGEQRTARSNSIESQLLLAAI